MSAINPRQAYASVNFNGSVGGTVAAVSALTQNYITHIVVGNTTAAIAYLQIFNAAAASVTVGTTAPTMVVMVPASSQVAIEFNRPIAMVNGALSCACTTARAGATGATCEVNIGSVGV